VHYIHSRYNASPYSSREQVRLQQSFEFTKFSVSTTQGSRKLMSLRFHGRCMQYVLWNSLVTSYCHGFVENSKHLYLVRQTYPSSILF